jgi:hypothetical protein
LTAVLFGQWDLNDKIELASTINKGTKKVFDGDPIFFPIPSDAPPEIPRVVLVSKNRYYRCNVAANRLELLYTAQNQPDKELQEIRDPYMTILNDIAETAKSQFKILVFRLGFIFVTLSFPENPIKLIENAFIREGALLNPEQLELHVLKKFNWDNILVNRWIRLSSVQLTGQEAERKALSVIFDINSVAEKRYDFSSDSITAFYSRAFAIVSDSIRTLFPSEP